MSNPFKKVFIFTILFLITTILSSQEGHQINKHNHTVIATSGLNLRAQATTTAEILTKLSYGTTVTQLIETTPTDGWIKAQVGNQNGYLYQKYLAPSHYKFPTQKINPDYALLLPNCTCYENFQYDEELEWIGVYKSTKDSFISEPTHFSYYYQKATIGTEICLEILTETTPEFIIGSKEQLEIHMGIFSPPFDEVDKETEALLHQGMDFIDGTNELFFCHNNRDIDFTEKDYIAQSIVWKGDINGDDIADFIIKYGTKMAKLVLILSDNTTSDARFIKVAEYYYGYCC